VSINISVQTADGQAVSNGMVIVKSGNNAVKPMMGSNANTMQTTKTTKAVVSEKKKPTQTGCGGGDLTSTVLMMGGVLLFFYLLVMRPQQKKQKQLQELRNSIMKGDRVVTIGGIIGNIITMTGSEVTLEVSKGNTLKIMRSSISGKYVSKATQSNKNESTEKRNKGKKNKGK
jgi:preprotein translocase subunit YajC